MSKYITYSPFCGTRITDAITDALNLAIKYNRPVRFRFNGQRVIANKRLSQRHILRQWEHASEASSLAYRRSPEHASEQARQAAQLESSQETVNALVAVLPTANTMDGVMAWLYGFTEAADMIGVKFNALAVATELETMGFIENEFVGRGQEIKTSDKMGRWIAGQAINCLRKGMGPHPVATHFIGQYLEMKKSEV